MFSLEYSHAISPFNFQDLSMSKIWYSCAIVSYSIFQFITKILENISEDSPWALDVMTVFISVVNCALLIHCEDVVILRGCMAALINVAQHFGKSFSIHGYEIYY